MKEEDKKNKKETTKKEVKLNEKDGRKGVGLTWVSLRFRGKVALNGGLLRQGFKIKGWRDVRSVEVSRVIKCYEGFFGEDLFDKGLQDEEALCWGFWSWEA